MGSQIQRVERSGGLELSSGQRQLWFRYSQEPTSHEYLMSRAWRIKGRLSVAILESACKEIVARHEILRTRYQLVRGEPVQVIDPIGGLVLTVADLSGTDDPARRARDIMDRAATLPIDLATRWPLRLRLLRLADDDHMLILVCHHIACDAWSMEVFASELSVLYAVGMAGKRLPLAPLSVQYADFAAWERSQAAEHARHLAYWERQLEGLPTLELPLDRKRSGTRSWAGDSYGFTFPWSLCTGIRALSRRYGTTPYPVLLTAFQVLLSRYTGSTDIPVGTVVSARVLAELKGLIGYGINPLIMRGRWAGDPTLGELIQCTKATTAAAFDHQNVPFPKLVDRLEPERDLSRTPLFQVAFMLPTRGQDVLTLPGLDVTSVVMPSRVARFDLTMLIDVAGNGALCGNLEYATALFDRATAARLATNYLRLLEQVIADPERKLSGYDVISPAERRVLLRDWDRLPKPAPRRRVHQMFEEQAAAHPDKISVISGETRLSYGELDARANRLAHALCARGVGKGSLVGIFLDRGPDLVVCLLAVLKSGAAYLPLDPAEPIQRLGFQLVDSAARLVITDRRLVEPLSAHYQGESLVLGDQPDRAVPTSQLTVPGGPDDPMYVIYTSDASGRPKGTVVSHGNVSRLFTATERWFGFSAADVWTLFHSHAANLSAWELWGALLHGGRLIVVPRAMTWSPHEFVDLLVRHRVTVLNQTPSAFGGLAAMAADGDPRVDRMALRLVVFGGEKLDLAELRGWVDRMGLDSPELVNGYGVTEASGPVSYHRLVAADFEDMTVSPIGAPLPDLRVCLLDRSAALVPIGVPGELYVGGLGLTQGYLGRPALTTERFVPDPFRAAPGPAGSGPGGRLYRSGDLARRRADGTLEFLGRIDDQTTGNAYVAPRHGTERRICQAWSEILGLSRIGGTDNFFELGGDSTRAVALAGRLRANGWDVGVRDIFEHPTVAALGELITGRSGVASSETFVAPFELISRDDRAKVPACVVDAYPMSQVQLDAARGRSCHSCTSYRVKDDRPFSIEALRRAARLLVERHEILRTAFDLARFSTPMQLVYAVAEIEVAEYDATDAGEAGMRCLLREFGSAERAKPFRDLRKPCLLRIAAHVSDDQVWWLSITEHHAILEGWSQHSLLTELLECYRAWRADEVPELPEPSRLRYADFVAAQQRALASPATRSYWKSIIRSYPKFRFRSGMGEPDGALLSRQVSVAAFADLDDGLRALAAAAGTPLKSVLLAAHLKVLSELTDQRDFHTGVVVPGRTQPLVSGMYLNSLPFAYDGGAVTWIDLVRRVFERENELWAHRNFPMPMLQRELGDGSRLLDTIFRYFDFHQANFQVIDHTLGIDDSPGQFRLSVHAQPGGFFIVADTRVLSRGHTDRLATRYRTVLDAMAADPGGAAR